MVRHAYRVLADCRYALDLLQEERRPQTFRILWVAAVGLARAVGHVLKNVDGKHDEAVGHAAEVSFKEWQANKEDHAILWEFILEERNHVLKQYELGFMEGPVSLTVGDEVYELDDNLFCPLTDGRFAGQDCRDVLAQAVEWWSTQLAAIEELARAGDGTT